MGGPYPRSRDFYKSYTKYFVIFFNVQKIHKKGTNEKKQTGAIAFKCQNTKSHLKSEISQISNL